VNGERYAFLDWMKCLGMAIIVFGHVTPFLDPVTPPFFPKQLGVAFFLFATGFSLARERRPSGQVLFNRLFEVFLFGIACALLMSAVTYARTSRLATSNYLPFLLGANVAFDHFPANPTTWYIGTYLHILLLWALALRRVRITLWGIALTAVAEVVVRAALIEAAGLFVAYMALPNWATVFLLGLYFGQRHETARPADLAPCVLLLGLLLVAWPALGGSLWPHHAFPFKRSPAGGRWVGLGLTSAAVTSLYVGYTWLAYQLTSRFRARAWVGFFARNTIIIFIAHMPLFYGLQELIGGWPTWPRGALEFTACFVGLALLSELVCRLISPKHLRDTIWSLGVARLQAGRGAEPGGKQLADVTNAAPG
jgi:hypothetical protein